MAFYFLCKMLLLWQNAHGNESPRPTHKMAHIQIVTLEYNFNYITQYNFNYIKNEAVLGHIKFKPLTRICITTIFIRDFPTSSFMKVVFKFI